MTKKSSAVSVLWALSRSHSRSSEWFLYSALGINYRYFYRQVLDVSPWMRFSPLSKNHLKTTESAAVYWWMLTYLSCKQSPTSASLRQKNRGLVPGGTLRDVAHAQTAAQQAGNHGSQLNRNQSAGTLMDCFPPLRIGTLSKVETCGS